MTILSLARKRDRIRGVELGKYGDVAINENMNVEDFVRVVSVSHTGTVPLGTAGVRFIKLTAFFDRLYLCLHLHHCSFLASQT